MEATKAVAAALEIELLQKGSFEFQFRIERHHVPLLEHVNQRALEALMAILQKRLQVFVTQPGMVALNWAVLLVEETQL